MISAAVSMNTSSRPGEGRGRGRRVCREAPHTDTRPAEQGAHGRDGGAVCADSSGSHRDSTGQQTLLGPGGEHTARCARALAASRTILVIGELQVHLGATAEMIHTYIRMIYIFMYTCQDDRLAQRGSVWLSDLPYGGVPFLELYAPLQSRSQPARSRLTIT